MQFQVIFQNSIAHLIFIGLNQPFTTSMMNRLEMVTECGTIVVLYHLFCFTDFVPDPLVRHNIGYSCVLFVSIFIMYSLLSLLGPNLRLMKQKAKLLYRKYIYKRSIKFRFPTAENPYGYLGEIRPLRVHQLRAQLEAYELFKNSQKEKG